MQYKYTSIRDVVGMLVRNTRLQDASYLADAHEWIFEAARIMETEYTTAGKELPVRTVFHKAKLPCDLESIDAVEYCGTRLPENKGARPPHRYSQTKSDEVYASTLVREEVIEGRYNYVTQLTAINNRPFNPKDYYFTEMGQLNTSFAEGDVILYYQALPVDDDNMPLIPDNQSYKNALYWYCRAMMIGSGWKDEQFDFQYCMDTQFEKLWAPRGMAEIRLPSPDQMERRVNRFQRLIPDAGYYDSFFMTDRPESFY